MQKSLRPCKHPGCPELTRDASGYCETHRPDARAYERYRGSARERGYNDEWSKFRKHYLSAHPLCVDCMAAGIYEPAKEIHHIKKLKDHPELKYDENNLIGLCKMHHSVRTARGE